ncbi:MAG: L,D-transpeptidase [Elusimicrobiales bacterium]
MKTIVKIVVCAAIAAVAVPAARAQAVEGIFDGGKAGVASRLLPGGEKWQAPDVPGMSEAVEGFKLEPSAVERLRREAFANPGRFIDERDPWEVGAAFGLDEEPLVRQLIPNDKAQRASVRILVNLSDQNLTIVSPTISERFLISSGVKGHRTPGSGRCYRPDFLDAHHRSSLYGNAPMPNSVFFNGNIAVHATESESKLGRPASHGCVRVSLEASKKIFAEVKSYGKSSTSICVVGNPPS